MSYGEDPRPLDWAWVALVLLWMLLLLSLLRHAAFGASAWVGPCTPTSSTHERWAMKTRPAPGSVHIPDNNNDPTSTLTAIPIKVQDMIAWDVPGGLDPHAKGPVDPKEEAIYVLTAHPILVKREKNDCDIHVEVADSPEPTAPRVIVEIPPTNPKLQVQFMVDIDRRLGWRPIHLDAGTSREMTFVGYGFLDLAHYSKVMGKKGSDHGSAQVATLFEIHPVLDVR